MKACGTLAGLTVYPVLFTIIPQGENYYSFSGNRKTTQQWLSKVPSLTCEEPGLDSHPSDAGGWAPLTLSHWPILRILSQDLATSCAYTHSYLPPTAHFMPNIRGEEKFLKFKWPWLVLGLWCCHCESSCWSCSWPWGNRKRRLCF